MNLHIFHDNEYVIIEVEAFLNNERHAVQANIAYNSFGFAPITDRIE
jgi:hypothetical protein